MAHDRPWAVELLPRRLRSLLRGQSFKGAKYRQEPAVLILQDQFREGISQDYGDKILAGVLAVAAIAIFTDLGLRLLVRRSQRYRQGRTRQLRGTSCAAWTTSTPRRR